MSAAVSPGPFCSDRVAFRDKTVPVTKQNCFLQRRHIKLLRALWAEKIIRVGLFQNVPVFVGPQLRVEWNFDGAELGNGKGQINVFGAVFQRHRHVVARTHANGIQTGSRAVHLLFYLAVSIRTFLMNQKHFIGITAGVFGKARPERVRHI